MALVHESIRIREEIDGARPGLTANITWFRSGDVKNTIPDRAEATVDVRALTSADLDWAFERIGEFGAHDGVEVRRSDDRGFPAMERAGWLADRTLEILGELGQPVLEEMAGGVSDGSWTSNIGIPTVDGLGPVGALDHTEEEYVEIASIDPRIEATVRLCRELGGATRLTAVRSVRPAPSRQGPGRVQLLRRSQLSQAPKRFTRRDLWPMTPSTTADAKRRPARRSSKQPASRSAMASSLVDCGHHLEIETSPCRLRACGS